MNGTGRRELVPVAVTSFVGRRHELSDLRNLLDGHRLVTLIGAGGVGKTRLAVQLAKEGRRAALESAVMVDLANVSEGKLVPGAFAMALGMQVAASFDSDGVRVASEFGDQEGVFLVDNCEHLLYPVAKMIDTMMRRCRNVRVIATSREPLGVSGEVTYPVLPFTVPESGSARSRKALRAYDCVELFLSRARAAVPAFELTEENAADVAELCARLEGIPLAIELAAVRLRALSPGEMLVRLEDRFRLLSCGSRTSDVRQQTLRASLDWSYELCGEEERILWARLTVLAGTFSLEAAEKVCGGVPLRAGAVYTTIASLVDKSILIRMGGTAVRYRMLETLRDYGRERLEDAGAVATLQEKHVRWFAELAEAVPRQWVSAEQVPLAAYLRLEHDNISRVFRTCCERAELAETGLRIAVAMEPYWVLCHHIAEGGLWLESLLRLKPIPEDLHVQALRVLSVLLESQCAYDEAAVCLRQAAEIVGENGTEEQIAHLAMMRGLNGLMTGRPGVGIPHLEECLPYFQRIGDRWLEMETLIALTTMTYLAGDLESSISLSQEIIHTSTGLGEIWFRSYAMWTHGMACMVKGDLDQAHDLELQAMQLKILLGDRLGTAACVETLAWIAGASEKYDESALLLGAANRLWDLSGSRLTAIVDQPEHRLACETAVSQALGAAKFRRLLARGQALSLDQILEVVTGETATADRPSVLPELTPRERDVAALVARGFTNRQIASELVIALRTAEGHLERIMAKLGFTSRAQLAAWYSVQSGGEPTAALMEEERET